MCRSKFKYLDSNKVSTSTLWKPLYKDFTSIESTGSWFDIKQHNDDVKQSGIDSKICNINIRTKPIKISPDEGQKKILLQWLEVYRRVYNLTVKYLKEITNPNLVTLAIPISKTGKPKVTIKSSKKINIPSFYTLRKLMEPLIQNHIGSLIKDCRILRHTRDEAVHDVVKAYKTAFTLLRVGHIKYFRVRYKKKSHHLKTLVLGPHNFSKKINGFAIKTLGVMKSSELFKTISKACRLSYNSRTKKFVLRVPYDKKTETTITRNPICSLDPGIRTFQTIYSPSGTCYQVATKDTTVQLTTLIKRIENVKPFKNHKRFVSRLREKLKNKVKDMHWKVANFLCKKFDKIIIGNMSTKSITSNFNNLHKTTKKLAYALSNFTFKERLQSKCKEYNVEYKEVDESYTSKTCGGCGVIKENLGCSKVFKCDSCDFVCDRDVNGARNIHLKNI